MRAAIAAMAAVGVVAAVVISTPSSSTPADQAAGGCREEATEPPRAAHGGHLEKAYFAPDEQAPEHDLQHGVGAGAVVVRYRPDLTTDQLRGLRDFVIGQRRRYVVAAPAPGQAEAITATATVRRLSCDSFNLGRLQDFRKSWIAQVDRHGGSLPGVAAAAAGKEPEIGETGGAARISSSDLPRGQWPLTVRSGEIRCEGNGGIVFRTPQGNDHAVTRVAADAGLLPLEALWRDKPGDPGTPMDITPLVERGLALCDPPLATLEDAKRFARKAQGEAPRDP